MTEPLDTRPHGRDEPNLRPERASCDGCGMSIAYRMLSRAVSAEYKVQLVIPACCGTITPGFDSRSAHGAPVVASPVEAVTSVATGLARVATTKDDDTRVIAWAGAGVTYGDGLAALSAAAERNEDVLYVCYDNEIYSGEVYDKTNGGGSPTTPVDGAIQPKGLLAIMAAHRVPYAASINLADPADTMRKMEHALDTRGFRFLQVLSPCPTGWESEPSESLELIRLAVESGLFPVIEIFEGRRLVINHEPEMSEESLERYLSSQGRFQRGRVSVGAIRQGVLDAWVDLRARAEA